MIFIATPENIDSMKYIQYLKKFLVDDCFLDFFIQKNIATPQIPACFLLGEKELSFDFFLGRSAFEEKDIIAVNENYLGRIPHGYLAIAQANEVDFICLNQKSQVFLWSRSRNDLYFSPSFPNKYRKQDKKLTLVAKSFFDFLGLIKQRTNIDFEENTEDDYENPNIPFEDVDIEDDFKYPDLFFKQSESAINIQLKKLLLSEKGRQLLKVFKEKKLI